MLLEKYSKVPVDRKRYRIDYTDWLDEGEIISDVTYTVTKTDGTVTTELTIDGTAIFTGNLMAYFFVNGGLSGKQYKVYATLTTNNGQVREDYILFSVKAE